jgi:signal transduction histidine kinase
MASPGFQYTPVSLGDRYLGVQTDITSLLLRDAPPDEVCEAIFTKLRSVLLLDAYFHFRVTSDGTRMQLASCRGCPANRLPDIEFLEFGQAVCGTVAARRKPMYVPHVMECVNDLTLFVRSIGITCYTCQPLIANGRLLGTFSFGTRTRTEYTPQELQLIQLVCDQVTIATARDIAREQQVRLERIAVAGQMAAKIAHEINNPLAAVTNIMYLLGTQPLPDEGKQFVAMAQEQLARVAQISKQTLSYYREEHPATAVCLRHATDSAVSVAAVAAERKRLSFAVDIARDLRVRAIDCELVQILTNLLANAVHFSPEQETVRVAALEGNSHVELYVSDHGPGVSPEHSTKLFQPFFTTKKESGNGLGLWISRELARRMDGDLLLVPSTQGATFKLSLKAAG